MDIEVKYCGLWILAEGLSVHFDVVVAVLPIISASKNFIFIKKNHSELQ